MNLNDERVEALLRTRYTALAAEAPCPHLETLARVIAEEAAPSERAEFADHWPQCDDCAPAFEALSEVRPVSPARRDMRSPRQSTWRLRLQGAVAGAAVAAALFVALRPGSEIPSTEPTPAPTLTAKGGDRAAPDRLALAVRRGEEQWRAVPGERLDTGDTVALLYTAETPGFVVVLHVDEAGEVTTLAPAEGGTVPLRPGRDVLLPDGGVLEPASGCEWFVGVFSNDAVAPEVAASALRQASRDPDRCVLRGEVPGARAVVTLPIRR